MAYWDLAVDLSAPRVLAAVAADGRAELLDLDAAAAEEPTGAAAGEEAGQGGGDVLASLLRSAATAGARGREHGAPQRAVIVHAAGWGDGELAPLREAAVAAGLPAPVFVARAVASGLYFRQRVALPQGTGLAVYDADADVARASVLRHTEQGLGVAAESADRGFAATADPEQAGAQAARDLAAVVDRAQVRIGELAGVYLVSAAALVPDLARRIRTALGFTVFVADRADSTAVLGALAVWGDTELRFGPGPAPVPTFSPALPLFADQPFPLPQPRSEPADIGHPPTVLAKPAADTVVLTPVPPQEPAAPPEAVAEGVAEAAPPPPSGWPTWAPPTSPGYDPANPYRPDPYAPEAYAPDPYAAEPYAPSGRRNRGPWPIVAAVALVAVCAGVPAYLLLSGHSSSGSNRKPSQAGSRPALAPPAPVPTESDPGTPVSDSPLPSDTTATPTETTTATPTPSTATDPASVVLAYFAAINAHDYPTAWRLGGKNLDASYPVFVAGFKTTANDVADAQDTGPATADVQLTATQTDGSQHSYAGPFTVVDGVITHTDFKALD